MDIPISNIGMVHPDTGGMSVSPFSPTNLPRHRRPPSFGGTGKDPVYSIDDKHLGRSLRYRPDPANPTGHGFVEPASIISFDDYQDAIARTAAAWRIVP